MKLIFLAIQLLPMIYGGISKPERRERAEEALMRVGLQDRLSNRQSQLSGGQQQQVAIARALVNHLALLLADEPTGALDSQISKEVMHLFDDLHEQGITIVIITHEPEVAAQTHRKIVLQDGLIVYSLVDFMINTFTLAVLVYNAEICLIDWDRICHLTYC